MIIAAVAVAVAVAVVVAVVVVVVVAVVVVSAVRLAAEQQRWCSSSSCAYKKIYLLVNTRVYVFL